MSVLKIKDGQGNWTEITSVASGPNRIQVNNQVVSVGDFAADTTYENFGYRAAIAIEGVDNSMTPEIILAPAESVSGVFCPTAATYEGGVYIYASEIPEAAITIPTIMCWYGATRVLGGSVVNAVTSINDITPDNAGNVDLTIDADMIADGVITQEKFAESIELGVTWTKLWENASPTSSFATQNIALNLRDYDMVVIFAKVADVTQGDVQPMICKVGDAFYMSAAVRQNLYRSGTVTTTSVNFGSGRIVTPYDTTATANDAKIIPYLIYGIKGVQ